jgi:prepilin signal peptidase PulO-like enzyme (type II secretory pathway)
LQRAGVDAEREGGGALVAAGGVEGGQHGGKLGGGDVKLLAALGALLGLTAGLLVVFVAVLCALLTRSRRLGPWALVGVVFVLAS